MRAGVRIAHFVVVVYGQLVVLLLAGWRLPLAVHIPIWGCQLLHQVLKARGRALKNALIAEASDPE